MKETRKVILEQGQQRITLEQGVESGSQTPQWDNMIANLKEGTAEKGTLFVSSFIQGLKPALIIGLIIMLIIAIKVC